MPLQERSLQKDLQERVPRHVILRIQNQDSANGKEDAGTEISDIFCCISSDHRPCVGAQGGKEKVS